MKGKRRSTGVGDIVIHYADPENKNRNMRCRTSWETDAKLTMLIDAGNIILDINGKPAYDPKELETATIYLRSQRCQITRVGAFEFKVIMPNGKVEYMGPDKIVQGALTVRKIQVEAERTSLMEGAAHDIGSEA